MYSKFSKILGKNGIKLIVLSLGGIVVLGGSYVAYRNLLNRQVSVEQHAGSAGDYSIAVLKKCQSTAGLMRPATVKLYGLTSTAKGSDDLVWATGQADTKKGEFMLDSLSINSATIGAYLKKYGLLNQGFRLEISALFNVPETGTYKFYVGRLDETVGITIDGKKVFTKTQKLETTTPSITPQDFDFSVKLDKGLHKLSIYFMNTVGTYNMQLYIENQAAGVKKTLLSVVPGCSEVVSPVGTWIYPTAEIANPGTPANPGIPEKPTSTPTPVKPTITPRPTNPITPTKPDDLTKVPAVPEDANLLKDKVVSILVQNGVIRSEADIKSVDVNKVSGSICDSKTPGDSCIQVVVNYYEVTVTLKDGKVVVFKFGATSAIPSVIRNDTGKYINVSLVPTPTSTVSPTQYPEPTATIYPTNLPNEPTNPINPEPTDLPAPTYIPTTITPTPIRTPIPTQTAPIYTTIPTPADSEKYEPVIGIPENPTNPNVKPTTPPTVPAAPGTEITDPATIAYVRDMVVKYLIDHGLVKDYADVVSAKVYKVDFADSCLGLQDPNEQCAQVITPGYKVVIYTRASGTIYVHTDVNFRDIRVYFADGTRYYPGNSINGNQGNYYNTVIEPEQENTSNVFEKLANWLVKLFFH